METLIREQILVTHTCISCGVLFAMPEELNERFLKDHSTFYCPNGHSAHYIGKTAERKLQEQLEREQEWRRSTERRLESARASAALERRRVAAYKGVLTKMRKRMGNGVCPVTGCKRTGFVNVRNHIHAKHPGWADEHLSDLDGV